MPPPPVIIGIIRPFLFSVLQEMKIITVRTARSYIRARLIILLVLIDPLPVHPFIKGTAVIKHTVQNDLHPASVKLLNQLNK